MMTFTIDLTTVHSYYDLHEHLKKVFQQELEESFDVLSGSKKEHQTISVKLKLEWLYRITTEPKRLKRFVRYNIPYGFKMLQYKEL